MCHQGGCTLEQIVSSSSLTRYQQSSERVLARVMRVVLSGDMQAIIITPSKQDLRAAQALLQVAARVERNNTLKSRLASSLISSTNVSKSFNHSAISREPYQFWHTCCSHLIFIFYSAVTAYKANMFACPFQCEY